MIEDWQSGGFGLYIHWPFCAAKCPYCDFNSHVVARIDHADWKQAYLAELDRVAAETQGRLLNSVFFGGGTPSLMEPETVDAILDRVAQHWSLANDIEITLEANPSSVEAARFGGFARAGVNRVSVGVQALNDRDLKRLGRLHDRAEALAAIDVARRQFDRVSFDLIYARQDQGLADWQGELTEALAMGPDHLSLYQLTIEDGTAFGDRFRAGRLAGLPGEDLGADLYDLTQEMCEAAGLPAYEVSNHAAPGAESRHNLIYWRYGDYLGVGPGAHGRLTLGGAKFATETPLAPSAWLSAVRLGGGESPRRQLTPQDVAGEYLMLGLRVSDGIDLVRLRGILGADLNPRSLSDVQDWGLVEVENDRLRLTRDGRRVLNAVVVHLLPG